MAFDTLVNAGCSGRKEVSMEIHLRIYDDRSDVPQPSGPVGVEVPTGATDDEIRSIIEEECADQARPYRVEFDDGTVPGLPLTINGPGWRLYYLDATRAGDAAGAPEFDRVFDRLMELIQAELPDSVTEYRPGWDSAFRDEREGPLLHSRAAPSGYHQISERALELLELMQWFCEGQRKLGISTISCCAPPPALPRWVPS